MNGWLRCYGGILGALACCVAAWSQSTIRLTTKEVVLDLIVRDKKGHPIGDLRPEEVTVLEDGVKQRVNQFRFVGGREQIEAETSAAKAEAARTQGPAGANSLREPNYVSIVFGPMAGANVAFARQAVLDFFKAQLLPNTFVTVYRQDTRLRLLQSYTDNLALLNRATENATRMQPGQGENVAGIAASTATSTGTLNTAAAGPGSTPMSQSTIPINDPTFTRYAATLDAATPGGAGLAAQGFLETRFRFLDSLVSGMTLADGLRELIRSEARLQGRKVVLYLGDGLVVPVGRPEIFSGLISAANQSGITFYTVDTRGLSLASPLMRSIAASNQMAADRALMNATQNGEIAGAENISSNFDAALASDDVDLMASSNTQMALRELAERTGGFATANTNDIARPMKRVLEDLRTHYEVAYTPASELYDGHFRKIAVVVNRPKVTVQTRSGYYALPELNGEPIQRFELTALNAINTKPAPAAFPFAAEVMKFRPHDSLVDCQIAFEVPLSSLSFAKEPKSDRAHMHASVFAIVQDGDGQVVNKVSRELFRDAGTGEIAKIRDERIEYAEPVALPSGHYTVSTVVVDQKLNRSSVQRRSLYIAPLAAGQLGLSSVEVLKRVEPLAGPRNPEDPFQMETQRVTPTLADLLPAGKPVPLYFVVYPGDDAAANPPKMTLEVSRDGKITARSTVDLPKPDVTGSIPVVAQMSLEPGSYSLRFTARQGTQSAQTVRSLTIQ